MSSSWKWEDINLLWMCHYREWGVHIIFTTPSIRQYKLPNAQHVYCHMGGGCEWHQYIVRMNLFAMPNPPTLCVPCIMHGCPPHTFHYLFTLRYYSISIIIIHVNLWPHWLWIPSLSVFYSLASLTVTQCSILDCSITGLIWSVAGI